MIFTFKTKEILVAIIEIFLALYFILHMTCISEAECRLLLSILQLLLMPFTAIVFTDIIFCVLTSTLYISKFKIVYMFDQIFCQGRKDLRTVSLQEVFMSLICFRLLILMALVQWRQCGCGSHCVQEGDGDMALTYPFLSLCQTSSQSERREEYLLFSFSALLSLLVVKAK